MGVPHLRWLLGIVPWFVVGFPALAAVGPGLYLRADLGVAYRDGSNFTLPAGSNGNDYATANGTTNGEGVPYGNLGVGYRFGGGFRLDGNLSYLTTSVSGSAPAPAAAPGAPFALSGARVEVVVGLINGYIDVADYFPETFRRIQPYVGAGMGAAGVNVGAAVGPAFACCGVSVRAPGASQTNFAWDLATGFAVPVADGVVVDVMYDYLHLGRVKGGEAAQFVPSAGATFATGPLTTDANFNRLSLGVRVAF